MGGRTIPKRVMHGDWPHDKNNITHDRRTNHELGQVAGVGPQYTDLFCPSCERRILATGECGGCS